LERSGAMLDDHPDIGIKIGPDVFSRVEPDGELLLVRPQGAAPPLVLLLKPPASVIWKMAQENRSLGDVIRIAKQQSLSESYVRNLVAHLCDLSLLFITGPTKLGNWSATELDAINIDPWEYQFSMPSLELPWFALWEITEHCQKKGRCAFCYRAESNIPDPTRAQWSKVLDQIIDCQVPFVTLLGGEPLIHEDIFDIIKALRANNIFVKLITNGMLVNSEVAGQLADAGINQVAVSIDGLTRQVNDKSRGTGAFDKALKAISLLSETIPRLSISYTVSSLSLDQMDKLPKFCEKHGVADVYISPLRASAQTKYPEGITTLDSDQSQRLAKYVEMCNDQGLKTIHLRQCSCGRSSMVIRTDGRVCPCPFSDMDVGNLFDQSLSSLWRLATDRAEKIGPVSSGRFCHRSFEDDASASGG